MPTVTTTTTGVFSGYTLSELRALCLRMLRQSNTARFSPTGGTADYDWIDDALNRGQEDFVRLTKCLRSYAIIELSASHRTYRVPEDFIDLMAAYYYDDTLSDGYRELVVTTVEKLNDEVSDWRTKLGSPLRIYMDRSYGSGQTIGLYPIPESNGDTLTFNSEYGVVVEWVCPAYTFNQDYGTVISSTGDDQFILPTQSGVSVEVTPDNKNILLEYYRLPQIITDIGSASSEYSEIPREYQKAICYYAAADLLSNNPEDSAEYKRSADLLSKFDREVATYIAKRKRPLSGQELRAVPNVWNFTQNMQWRKELP